MDLASRFNETGVRLYKEGRGSEAFDMFHASLEVMLRTTGRTTAHLDPMQCQSLAFFYPVQQALSKDAMERRLSQAKEAALNPSQIWNNDSAMHPSSPSPFDGKDRACMTSSSGSMPRNVEDPCLYPHVFEIRSPVCHDYQQYIVSLATDIYNMALMLQQGLVNDKMTNCLERALVLYSFAGELLWNNLGYTLTNQVSPASIPVSTIYCAVLNNTGYLLHQMGRFEWSQLFFQRLYQFLELLGPAGSESEQRDRDTFQLNVVALYGTLTTAGAA